MGIGRVCNQSGRQHQTDGMNGGAEAGFDWIGWPWIWSSCIHASPYKPYKAFFDFSRPGDLSASPVRCLQIYFCDGEYNVYNIVYTGGELLVLYWSMSIRYEVFMYCVWGYPGFAALHMHIIQIMIDQDRLRTTLYDMELSKIRDQLHIAKQKSMYSVRCISQPYSSPPSGLFSSRLLR